jgi:alcohol dehydrogenase class IV
VALLDPELLLTLPPKIAIAASVDALCHAIEAYLSTDANIITDALALEAIRLLAQNIGPASLTQDTKAREKVLVASSMANIACGNAKLGLIHGLTYGDFNGHSHGMSNSLMLPFVLEFLLPAAEEKMAKLAGALGEPLSGVASRDAAAAISAIRALYTRLGVPRSLVELGMREAKLDELVDISLRQVHLQTSIRPANRSDIEGIFRRAFAGW